MSQTIDTDRLKQSIDLRDIAERYTTLHRQSVTESAGPCPFCGGTDRFRVFADHFFCRPDGAGHCGRTGDAITLIMERESVDFKKACELLSDGVLPTTSTPVKPVKPTRQPNEWDEAKQLEKVMGAHKALMAGRSDNALLCSEYLSGRGITEDTQRVFKLGYRSATLPSTWDNGKKVLSYPKQSAITFPWFERDGTLPAVKYRFIESHDYVDIGGKQRTENKTSRGNFLGRMFGWQAVKGPERNQVLIITEGEMNALSLWQAGDGLLDVLSPGTESMMQGLPTEIIEFAQQYPYRIVWADKGNIADSAALSIGAASMRSPGGQDANDLLKAGRLKKLLVAMLKKFGAIVEASPLPSVKVIKAGLPWHEAERLHKELKAACRVGVSYRIAQDPAGSDSKRYMVICREVA